MKNTQLTTDNDTQDNLYDMDTDMSDLEDSLQAQVKLAKDMDYHANFMMEYQLAQDGKGGNPQYWKDFMKASDMSSFMGAAYDSPDGYAIRTNPLTGVKEMMIAGTHGPLTVKGIKEWGSNILEGLDSLTQHGIPVLNNFSVHREGYGDKIAEIAEQEGVQVVYGHSRGAAIMSHFDEDKFVGIGLDGATYLGEAKQKFINVNAGKQVFDRAIGAFHKRTVHVEGVTFHDVTKTKYSSGAKAKAEKKAAKEEWKKAKKEAKKAKREEKKRLGYGKTRKSSKRKSEDTDEPQAKKTKTDKKRKSEDGSEKKAKKKKEDWSAESKSFSVGGGKKQKVVEKLTSTSSKRKLSKVTKKNLSTKRRKRR